MAALGVIAVLVVCLTRGGSKADVAMVGLQLPESPGQDEAPLQRYSGIRSSFPTLPVAGAPHFVGTPDLFDEEG